MPRPNTGPHLAPGKNGIWDISFSNGGRSSRRSTGTKDRLQAQKVLAAFLTLDHRDSPGSKAEIVMVRDVLGDPAAPSGADYWHEHVLEHVIGQETQRLAIGRLLLHFGPIEVRRMVPADVSEYVRRRREGWPSGRRVGDATIRRDLGVLGAAIHHAVKAKRLDAIDAPAISLPPAPEAKDRWLTHEEADRLFAAALVTRATDCRLPRVYRFAVIALATASRKTAILELKLNQIDMERGTIRLNPPGRRQTKKKRPSVPISDELRPILERILKGATSEYVLDHPGAIRTAWQGVIKRAQLPGVTPHTLRHTWATWAAQAGVDMWMIAGVLGDSMDTVVANYAHHSPEHLRAAVNAVKRKAA